MDNIVVRVANLTEIEDLVKLNLRWHLDTLGDNISNGYLLDLYTFEKFYSLIQSKEVIVGLFEGKVVSYYLLNTVSHSGSSHRHEAVIGNLKERLLLPHNCRVGFGAQALVDKDFQGTSLRKKMLIELINSCKEKYDYLFSTISKGNLRAFKAHIKDGWEVLDDDVEKYYVIFKVNKSYLE